LLRFTSAVGISPPRDISIVTPVVAIHVTAIISIETAGVVAIGSPVITVIKATRVIAVEASIIMVSAVGIIAVEPPGIVPVGNPGAVAIATTVVCITTPQQFAMVFLTLCIQLVMIFADSGTKVPVIRVTGSTHLMEHLADAVPLPEFPRGCGRPVVDRYLVIPLDCGTSQIARGRMLASRPAVGRGRRHGGMPTVRVVGSPALSPRGGHQQQATQRAVDDGASHGCLLL
jgi:hypothetical protein